MVELNAELAVTELSVPAEVDMLGAIPVVYEPTSGRGGLSDEIKQAILDCFQHVAWVDPDGAEYYQALYDLFFPPAELVRISAVYTQSGTVYPTTSLDSLKSDLVVKAHYSDGSAVTLSSSDYTLSGSLTVGTSTVTVTYSGKSTSFSVTVSALPTVSSISATYTQSGIVYSSDSLDSLKDDLVVTATYTDSSSETVPSADYTLSGSLTAGTSTVTVTYESKTTTFTVSVTAAPTVLRNWDFTQSLTDSVASATATTTASRDSGGLKFTAKDTYCDLGTIYSRDRTYEIDIVSISAPKTWSGQSSTYRRPWAFGENGAATASGSAAFVFTGVFPGSTRSGWWFYKGSAWDSSAAGSDIDTNNDYGFFDGKTLKIYLNSSGYASIYVKTIGANDATYTKVGESHGALNNYSTSNAHVYIGGTSDTLADAVITGYRVYEGEK